MRQNLTRPTPHQNKEVSPWIKYFAVGAVILLLFAASLYAFRYMSLDREFHHNIKTFGEETYKEIFSLHDSKDEAESLMEFAEEAFSFIGSEADAINQFGILGRYSCTDAGAVAESHSLDYIVSRMEGDRGYIWVAYTRASLDPGGEAISASGSDKTRILARWVVERHGPDLWTVTQVWEGS